MIPSRSSHYHNLRSYKKITVNYKHNFGFTHYITPHLNIDYFSYTKFLFSRTVRYTLPPFNLQANLKVTQMVFQEIPDTIKRFIRIHYILRMFSVLTVLYVQKSVSGDNFLHTYTFQLLLYHLSFFKLKEILLFSFYKLFLYHIFLLLLARFKIDSVQKYYYLLEIISSWFYTTRNISISMLRDLCFLIYLKKGQLVNQFIFDVKFILIVVYRTRWT